MVSIRFYDDGWINKTAFFHYFNIIIIIAALVT